MPWALDAKSVWLAINGWWALCIELMASLLRGLVAYMARPEKGPVVGSEAAAAIRDATMPAPPAAVWGPAEGPKLKRAAPFAPSLESFLSCLAKRPGSVIAAADLLASYCQHCKGRGVTPETQRALGMAGLQPSFRRRRRATCDMLG